VAIEPYDRNPRRARRTGRPIEPHNLIRSSGAPAAARSPGSWAARPGPRLAPLLQKSATDGPSAIFDREVLAGAPGRIRTRDPLLRRSSRAGGQPALVQLGHHSHCPRVTAEDRLCLPVLARIWHGRSLGYEHYDARFRRLRPSPRSRFAQQMRARSHDRSPAVSAVSGCLAASRYRCVYVTHQGLSGLAFIRRARPKSSWSGEDGDPPLAKRRVRPLPAPSAFARF
jgi:hypothetical protein